MVCFPNRIAVQNFHLTTASVMTSPPPLLRASSTAPCNVGCPRGMITTNYLESSPTTRCLVGSLSRSTRSRLTRRCVIMVMSPRRWMQPLTKSAMPSTTHRQRELFPTYSDSPVIVDYEPSLRRNARSTKPRDLGKPVERLPIGRDDGRCKWHLMLREVQYSLATSSIPPNKDIHIKVRSKRTTAPPPKSAFGRRSWRQAPVFR